MASRQNAFRISDTDLERYRNAVRGLKDISGQNLDDERGYFYFAGIHGLPVPTWCAHGTLLFLPWHRAYLYFLELALQQQIPAVGIPWWDWLSDEAHAAGLPPGFTSPATSSNPLLRTEVELHPSYIELLIASGADLLDASNPNRPLTRRDPGDARFLPHRTPPPDLPDEFKSIDWFNLDNVLQDSNFASFSNRLEDVHGGLHGWVGGSMSSVPTAAFDPIFFSHHGMIDQLWYRWQVLHGAVGPDEQLWDIVLTPFPVTVRDMLNVDQLNYEYVEQTFEV